MYDRILKLIKKEELDVIKQAHLLIIGIGGVGGYMLEALVRSGFLHITVIDSDVFDITNLNRQILATEENIGKEKVIEAQKRAKLIEPDCEITPILKKLTEEDITKEFIKPYDYIIDACDTVLVKKKLFEVCSINQKNFISSMGTANRIHPESFIITSLEKTKNDPLAKKLRTLLKANKKALKCKVVCSLEVPKKQKELGTIAPVPMAAGAIIASEVIRSFLQKSPDKK